MVKVPSGAVKTLVDAFVLALVKVTAALGMAAPEGVVIVPESVPGVSACITGTQISRSKTNSFENRFSMKYLENPLSGGYQCPAGISVQVKTRLTTRYGFALNAGALGHTDNPR